VQGFSRLGAISEGMKDCPIDLMPIDMAAKEVLALREGEYPVYHIMSHVPPKMIDVLKAVNPKMEVVSEDKMNRLFMEQASSMPKELLPFLMEQKMNANTERAQIEVANRITVEQLEKLGFKMELPGPERLLKEFRG